MARCLKALASAQLEKLLGDIVVQAFILIFLVTFLTSLAIIVTEHMHGHWSHDTSFGVQNHHLLPTPRIGGVAVMVGAVFGWWLAGSEVRTILAPTLLASIPAFTFGLAEDITKRVGVLPRLLATVFSGVTAWYLTGIAMQNTGISPVDWLLDFMPVAVLLTAFAVGGVANAVNIIDGFNGLASGSVTIMLAALGIIAGNLGDSALASVCFTLTACSIGFAAVNWPLGKIFLGDGGAYLLGFVLAWLAVLLPMRNPEVNAWTSILVCIYPVLEVAFSVIRRRRREGHHPGQPDKVHLHHLVHRRIVCQLLPHTRAELKNGFTSPLCWLLVAVPAAWAVYFAENTPMLISAICAVTLGYSVLYTRLSQFRFKLIWR